MMTVVLVAFGFVALAFVITATAYLMFGQSFVRVWFAEESRRDVDARRRRRAFEDNCCNALLSFFSIIFVRTLAEADILIAAKVLLIAQGVAGLLTILFFWAAFVKWRHPFKD